MNWGILEGYGKEKIFIKIEEKTLDISAHLKDLDCEMINFT